MSKIRFINSIVISVVIALILSLPGISKITAREDLTISTVGAASNEAGAEEGPVLREATAGLPGGPDQIGQAEAEINGGAGNAPEQSSTPGSSPEQGAVPKQELAAGEQLTEKSTGAPPQEAVKNEPVQETVKSEPAPPPTKSETPPPAAPVSFSWGAAQTYRYRTEIVLTNSGAEVSQGVLVRLPLLENSSPYQNTTLTSINYEPLETTGRTSSFHLGDMQPGETKTLIVDYTITVRPVWLNSTNATVEKARQAYREYAGSGNCFVLAAGFVNRSRELGLTARVVNGIANPQRGIFAPGYIQNRHSWAEFYVEGPGWVPVDLTFQYFGQLPQASHIVENYADQSLKLNYFGGRVSAVWHTRIL